MVNHWFSCMWSCRMPLDFSERKTLFKPFLQVLPFNWAILLSFNYNLIPSLCSSLLEINNRNWGNLNKVWPGLIITNVKPLEHWLTFFFFFLSSKSLVFQKSISHHNGSHSSKDSGCLLTRQWLEFYNIRQIFTRRQSVRCCTCKNPWRNLVLPAEGLVAGLLISWGHWPTLQMGPVRPPMPWLLHSCSAELFRVWEQSIMGVMPRGVWDIADALNIQKAP